MPASITLARALALALGAGSGLAWGGTLDYTLYAGVQHSDNITLSTQNPVSQNELIPGLNFMYLQQGSTLQANITGTLEYHDYPGTRFDNQTQTQLAGQANWTVLPQRLDFSVMDYAGVQPVDSLASNAPDNQQQTNVLSLGPILHLQFGDALRAQAELQYITSYASKVSDFNSSRGLAAFRLFRDISPTDQLSANIETQRVTFDDSNAGSDYNRNELFVGYNSKLAKFDFSVVLGWSQLDFNHEPSASSPLARVTVDWQPTVRSRLAVNGAYQYADAAQNMLLSPGENVNGNAAPDVTFLPGRAINDTSGGIGVGNAIIDSQVYLERTLGASYTFTAERLALSIAPLYRKLHYLNNSIFDQTGRGGSVTLSYRLRPTLTLSTFVTGERLVYQGLDRTDRTFRYGLDLSRRQTSHWSWHASLIRQHRDSNAVEQSYHEAQIFFGVVFRR